MADSLYLPVPTTENVERPSSACADDLECSSSSQAEVAPASQLGTWRFLLWLVVCVLTHSAWGLFSVLARYLEVVSGMQPLTMSFALSVLAMSALLLFITTPGCIKRFILSRRYKGYQSLPLELATFDSNHCKLRNDSCLHMTVDLDDSESTFKDLQKIPKLQPAADAADQLHWQSQPNLQGALDDSALAKPVPHNGQRTPGNRGVHSGHSSPIDHKATLSQPAGDNTRDCMEHAMQTQSKLHSQSDSSNRNHSAPRSSRDATQASSTTSHLASTDEMDEVDFDAVELETSPLVQQHITASSRVEATFKQKAAAVVGCSGLYFLLVVLFMWCLELIEAYWVQVIQLFVPIFVALLSRLVSKVPLPAGLWPTVAMGTVGGALITLGSQLGDSEASPSGHHSALQGLLGGVLALLATLLLACFMLAVEHSQHLIGSEAIMWGSYSVQVAVSLVVFAFRPDGAKVFALFKSLGPDAWAMLVLAGVGVNFLADLAEQSSIRAVGAPLYSTCVAVQVVVAMIGEYFLLNEAISSVVQYLGVFIVVVTITVFLVCNFLASTRKK